MTYRELLAQIQALSPEQLDANAQYQDTNDGEFYGITGIQPGSDFDLPDSQPVLGIEQ